MKQLSADITYPISAADAPAIAALRDMKLSGAAGVDEEVERLLSAGGLTTLSMVWVKSVKAGRLISESQYSDAVDLFVEILRALIDDTGIDRKNLDFLAIVASVFYHLALIHNRLGDNKKAEKELVKAQKILDKLAKKDNTRFAAALVEALNASTDIFQSKLKLMNLLAHYQVAADLYQNKVASGVTNAVDRLVDSLRNQGDIHLKIGNYRDAVKYYTKALRYQKRVNSSMGLRELQISLNMSKALLNIINRHSAGEQLLESLLPLADRLGAKDEAEEIKNLQNNFKKSFDIMTFFKKLFVLVATVGCAMSMNAQTIIGHRGSVWGVENTRAAFVNGINNGYEGLECDIHCTSDGIFVVNHDNSYKRVGGPETDIANMTAREVLSTTLTQTRDGKFYESRPITLGEFLDICNEHNVIPVVEIKDCWNIYSHNDNPNDYCYDGIPALINLIDSKKMSDKVVIISFMAGVLDAIHKQYPNIHMQFLTGRDWKPYEKWCKKCKMDIDVHHSLVSKELVESFHKDGLKVNAWTIDDPAVFKRVQDLGVDMITTNKLSK